MKRLEEERQAVKELEIEAKKVKEVAQRALEVCQEIRADPESADHLDEWGAISNDLTVDHLEMEIAAEESKLEYIHANNPNAIRDFEKRQKDVDRLKEKIAGTEEQLGELQRRINHVRGKWEPELDKLIAEISDAFSYNFEQIGCAGEVGVHKDDDFEQWAIQIKVKFRQDNFTLPFVTRTNCFSERMKLFKSWTSIANPVVSDQSRPFSISCHSSLSHEHHSVSSTKSTKAWIHVMSGWYMNAWLKLLAKNTPASTSLSRRSCSLD